jgi:hypothetical protein
MAMPEFTPTDCLEIINEDGENKLVDLIPLTPTRESGYPLPRKHKNGAVGGVCDHPLPILSIQGDQES